ncbi:MAG: tail fiber domain-containing protein [Bacteroidota bacterium]
MKTLLLGIALLTGVCAFSQNIGIGTETPQGKLHIKGSADTAQLVIDANTTQSGKQPLILLRTSAGAELLRIHADEANDLFIGYQAGQFNQVNASSTANTFIGSAAGALNATGYHNTALGSTAFSRNTTGAHNVAVGTESLTRNTEGYFNTAVGASALIFNSKGFGNTALGYTALYASTTGGNNTGLGYEALVGNTTGTGNTAVGVGAIGGNGPGSYNTAIGVDALFHNNGAAASYNTAIGSTALFNTKNSQFNTALGYNAGSTFDNGYNNVFLGANTDVNGAGYFNVIAIGQSTVCTASSQVTIGNGATNAYRAYANWSNISDGRFKKNIQENVPGLAFITQLRPVTYNLKATELDNFLHPADNTLQRSDNTADAKTGGNGRIAATPANETATAAISKALKEKEQVIQTGFVAQEVEATAKKMGFNFSGIDAPANDKDVYGLRYAEFVVPLVKAVQELNANQQDQIKALSSNNTKQQQELESMKTTISNLQQQVTELKALIKK